jgi:hypothetical protein
MNTHIGSRLTAFGSASIVFLFTQIALAQAQPKSVAKPATSGPAFEAYYKFYLGDKHSGYTIQRLEVNDAKKQMVSTYYCYVKTPSGSSIESLSATADLNFEPISYQYTSLVDGKPKLVDANFSNKKMTATIVENGHAKKSTLTVRQNGFLSTFLNYVILKNGMTTGRAYDFFALSEEDPGFHEGTASILSEQKVKGIDAYKINITYKGVEFTALVTNNGEPLGTLSPQQNASTEMVASRAEAIGSLPFNEKQISTLFKGIPEGKNNKLARGVAPAAAPSNSGLVKMPMVTGSEPSSNAPTKGQGSRPPSPTAKPQQDQ